MLTVLMQNIWGGAPFWRLRRAALARGLARCRPDVIGLVEVHADDSGDAGSQAHELARSLGAYEVAFAPGRVAASGRREGVAILSRHPVIERESLPLTQDPGDRLDRFGPRVVLRALIATPEGSVDVYVTHLSLSRRARARTVPEVIDFASRSAGRRAILMGDLNAEPDEPTVGALLGDGMPGGAGWLDAWASRHDPGARGGTWPALAPYRRIDYIFARPEAAWDVHSSGRLATGSDHLGVIARLALV